MNESETWLPALFLLLLSPWPFSKLLCVLRPRSSPIKWEGGPLTHWRLLSTFYRNWSKAISLFSCSKASRCKLLFVLASHGQSSEDCSQPNPTPLWAALDRSPLPIKSPHPDSELCCSPPLPCIKSQKDPITNNLHILIELGALLLCFQPFIRNF